MAYSVFDPNGSGSHLTEPMFFGEPVGVARYESQKYPEFEHFTDRQLSFFWRPEEVKLSGDRVDYMGFERHEEHIYTSNIFYQIIMDSVQGRAPAAVFGAICSLPELEAWLTTWTFSETIHSRSYTHMIRNIMNDPGASFDRIMSIPELVARAKDVARYYDTLHHYNVLQSAMDAPLIRGDGKMARMLNRLALFARDTWTGLDRDQLRRDHKRAVVMCLYSVNALEAIRFYASFACTFLFHKAGNKMGGSAKIMRLIARDEALHHASTNTLIGILRDGDEGAEWAAIVAECEAEATQLFVDTVNQELDWCKYLFQYGSMLGMNEAILGTWVKHTAHKRMESVGLRGQWPDAKDTLPWVAEYLSSENVQGTPQESENASYTISNVDMDVTQDADDLDIGDID